MNVTIDSQLGDVLDEHGSLLVEIEIKNGEITSYSYLDETGMWQRWPKRHSLEGLFKELYSDSLADLARDLLIGKWPP